MKIAIIGAGPAGIYTSLLLKNFPGEVTLFEQNNDIGAKLKLTGGGRMNICNKNFTKDYFSSSNDNLLKRIFKSPWLKKRLEIFQELGVEFNWEKNRAILKSKNAIEEVHRLKSSLLSQSNLNLLTNSKVEEISINNNKFTLNYSQDSSNQQETFDALVLCTGGMFRIRNTQNSSNEIYKLSQNLNHNISALSPSLSPLQIKNNPWVELSGLSCVAKLNDPISKKSLTGDLLFTHQGISGPVVLDFSAILSNDKLRITFITSTHEEDFTQQFNKLRQGRNLVKNFLKDFLPKRLISWHLEQVNISETAIIADINKEKFKQLRQNLFHFMVKDVRKMDYQNSWTTKGGVQLDEINTATLESKLHPNLFFAGEVLDVNGLCGGYNISWAAISAKIVSEHLQNY